MRYWVCAAYADLVRMISFDPGFVCSAQSRLFNGDGNGEVGVNVWRSGEKGKEGREESEGGSEARGRRNKGDVGKKDG